MPRVTIIVPVYNVECYVGKCINSILNQTYYDFELILIDDGSTDKSGAICDEYARSDERIKVIHKINEGVSIARNTGINIAIGEYITFIDSDDYVLSDYLEKLLKNPYDLTVCSFAIESHKSEESKVIQLIDVMYKEKENIDYEVLYQSKVLFSPWGKLFKRNLIIDNDLHFSKDICLGEDAIFVVDYLSCCNSVLMVNYAGYIYMQYENSINLTKKISYSTIDMFSFSREYVVDRVLQISNVYLSNVIEDNMKDIAGYVQMLIIGNTIYSRKRKILDHFLENRYLQETIKEPERFYSSRVIRSCIDKGNAKQILKLYRKTCRAEKNRMIKGKIYVKLPLWIKHLRNQLKKRIHIW